jgi:hypothetical protein
MKNKGKKGKKIVVDLDSFKAQEAQIKTSEKDINHKSDSGLTTTKSPPVIEINKNEEEVSKFNPSLLEYNTPAIFYALDNKLIDTYYSDRMDIFTDEEKDILTQEEFLHYVRFVCRDIEFLLSLRFAQFWGLVSKTPEISRFFDDFLQNARKHNDIFKMQHLSHFTEDEERLSTQDASMKEEIRVTMNRLLKLVLRVYFRLSLTIESDEEYFSLAFYQKIIYDNWIFDMAKLIDLAAIYARSNPATVTKLILNVFDNEPRFVQDFKETVDMLMNLLKSRFKEYQKVKAMLNGDYLEAVTVSDQEQAIQKYLNDYIEILSNFTLVAQSFPESILEILRGTNALIFLANTYCLTIHLKRDISQIIGVRLPKLEKGHALTKKQHSQIQYVYAKQIQTLKKLCV